MRMDLKDEQFSYIAKLVLADLNTTYPGLKKQHIFYAIRGLLKSYNYLIKTLTLEDINAASLTGFRITGLGTIKYKYEWGTIKKVGFKVFMIDYNIFSLIKFLKRNGITRIYSTYDLILFYNYNRNEELRITRGKIYARFSYLFEAVEESVRRGYINIEDLANQFPMYYNLEELKRILPKDKYANKKIYGKPIIGNFNGRELIFDDMKNVGMFFETEYKYNYRDAVKNIKKILNKQRTNILGWTMRYF